MPDISKITVPAPDFGTDEVGRIALFMHWKRRTAEVAHTWESDPRKQAKEGRAARKKAQTAYKKLVAAIDFDPELAFELEDAGLLDPIESAKPIIKHTTTF